MSLTPSLVESLLWEDESNTVDFKATQYPFADATEDQKGEIIKDILAFANTFRRDDAYVLLGIRDVKGGRGIVTGVAQHLDDANLQQLVNSKTNRTVEFHYHAIEIDKLQVGVIHIPRQDRPSYVTKKYGKLQAYAVYLRRGSSTSIATPEEIARMGADQAITNTSLPTLDLQFATRASHERHGAQIAITSLVLHTPNEIPDYREQPSHSIYGFGDSMTNRNYYRELVAHTVFVTLAQPCGLAVENTSSTTAEDVRLGITIDDPDEHLAIFDEDDIPSEPDATSILRRLHPARQQPEHDVVVRRTGTAWQITARFGKVQPKATIYLRSRLFVGAYRDVNLILDARLYADNLPEPHHVQLALHITSIERTVTLGAIQTLHADWFKSTPRGQAMQKQREKKHP